jgi:methionyl aminopeptidase
MSDLSTKHLSQLAGGQALSEILFATLSQAKPGVSTLELETYFDRQIHQRGFTSSFKTVGNYPFSTCINLNEGIVHGFPQKNKIIKKGDILSIDGGLIHRGFHTDMAFTAPIGPINKKIDHFLKIGQKALSLAIKAAQPGRRIGHISQAIQTCIESAGYSVSPNLTGHSIGKKLHEEPFIPGILKKPLDQTPFIKPGQSLAIEVIYTLGSPQIRLEPDGWTLSTVDKSLSALFEKTILIGLNSNQEATIYPKNLIK